MNEETTEVFKVHFAREGKGKVRLREGEEPTPRPPRSRVPRISRLLALAMRFDQLVRSQQVRDFAHLARYGQVSRARMTQVMNLLNLAPDIQERVLFWQDSPRGMQQLTERHLRQVATCLDWRVQRQEFAKVVEQVNRPRTPRR